MPVIPLPANTVMNVQMYGTLAGQRIITLFQYRATGTPNPSLDYFDYIDSLNTEVIVAAALRDTFLQTQSFSYRLDFIRYQPVFPTRLRFVDKLQGILGTWTANPASTANVAASIERFARTGRRHGIGRVQLPCPDGVYTAGIITTAGYLTSLFNLAGLMPLTISTTAPAMTWQPVICNTSVVNPTTNIVEGATEQTTVRTMHRRTVGLGI